MTLPPGTTLGPYVVLEPLGSGGMGEVYRGSDPRLGRQVALKVLPQHLTHDPDSLARFEREARAIATLSHPNLLAIHDFGTDRGICYAAMELLDGETLRDRLAHSRIPPPDVVRIGATIADGLSAAHARGVIHRDLKPENVFMTSDGLVKILDFGLARLQREEPSPDAPTAKATPTLTQAGTVMGTVGYMAPEQVRGRLTDQRTDIFSLGCILYEMAIGHAPFSRESAADTMASTLNEEANLTDLHQRAPELARVVKRCLEKSPEERFQSARDLSFALRDTLSGTVEVAAGARRRSPNALLISALAITVAAALLFTLNVGGLRDRISSGGKAQGAQAISSLAVLPLENLSRDPEQEYFADGMTEALTTTLAKIGGIRVISRSSAMRYKGTRKDLRDIARELRVDAVVEGAVLRSDQRVRITAQLVDAATDRHLWAESYERDLHRILELQNEVAGAIAQQIQVALTPQERASLSRHRPVKPEAHESYLRGLYYWNRRTPDSIQKAIAQLKTAIGEDPGFAPAHAALADCYNLLGSVEYSALPPRDAMPQAKEAALRALELDEHLAQAHNSLAHCLLFYDWDWRGAEAAFRRAIELNPNYATAHQWYGIYLMLRGRTEESIAETNRARELDPLSLIINVSLGTRLYYARKYDLAVQQYLEALELDPTFAMAHLFLGRAYVALGRVEDAIGEFQQGIRLSGGSLAARAFLGHAYGVAGQAQNARKVLSELVAASRRVYVPAYAFAAIHTGLGENDRAIERMYDAYEERSGIMVYLPVDPLADGYRTDPRFIRLLERVR